MQRHAAVKRYTGNGLDSYSLNVLRNFCLLTMLALTVSSTDLRTATRFREETTFNRVTLGLTSGEGTLLHLLAFAYAVFFEWRNRTPWIISSVPWAAFITLLLIARIWLVFFHTNTVLF